jgi:hypothetical protein
MHLYEAYFHSNNIKIWKKLFAGTPPVFKNLFAGTPPFFKNLFGGTPPSFKNLFAGTPPAFKSLFAGTLLPKSNSFEESFGKEQLICSALEGNYCGIGSFIVLNTNPLKLVYYFLLMMNI